MSARLLHIRGLLAQGEPLPPPSAVWLVRSIDRLLAGDDPVAVLDLGRAAGLRERNRLLRQAAAGLEGTPYQKATQLASLARRHEDGRQAPGEIVQASRAAPLPKTQRQMWNIIR
jgi:hypothetical protein